MTSTFYVVTYNVITSSGNERGNLPFINPYIERFPQSLRSFGMTVIVICYKYNFTPRK